MRISSSIGKVFGAAARQRRAARAWRGLSDCSRFRPTFEILEGRVVPTAIHWINANGGSWNVAANWDLNRVPGPGDDVVINVPNGGVVTYSTTGSSEIQSLDSTQPFTLSRGMLRVDGQVQVDGAFLLAGGALQGATILAGTTLRSNFGLSALQDVTLLGNLLIPEGNVAMSGTWVNRGSITVNGGSIDFFGSFTTATIGNFHYTAGSINIDGVMDNTGSVLMLNDAVGSWHLLNSGTIRGGTIVTLGSNSLSVGRGILDGVTFYGNLDVSDGSLTVVHGLTLDGTMTVGNSGRYGYVTFQDSQTLGGTAYIRFGNSSLPNSFGADNFHSVTLAPTITVAGGSGMLVNVINHGTIDASAANANLTLMGAWQNQGVVIVGQGTINLGGSFPSSALGVLRRTGGTVNLIGTLENSGQILTLNAVGGSWHLAGGTVHGGTIITQDGASFIPTSQTGTFDGVMLNTDVDIAAGAHLALAGSWTNRGTLSVDGGTLDLGGAFTETALGVLHRNGGIINLRGILNNTGNTLLLNAVTGPWVLTGGTIHGGVVTLLDGIHLRVTSVFASTLDGVTINGYLDVGNGELNVSNGLTLNGTLVVGDSGRFDSGTVRLQGDQNLSGAGTIIFGTSSYNSLGTLSGMVTFGPDILIRGGTGQLNNFINQGTIEVATPDASLSLVGAFGWRNKGTILLAAGTLNLGGTFTTDALGNFIRAGGTVNLTGTLNNTGQSLTLSAATGAWRLAGGTVLNGTLVTQNNVTLLPTSQGGTLSGLTINTNLTITSGTSLTLAGTWVNHGTLAVSAGTLNLGGAFNMATLGSFQRLGGFVNLTGTLDNTGQTLILNSATGSWRLAGGTIRGGTLTAQNGTTLTVTNQGGTLDGVAIDTDLTVDPNTTLSLSGTWINRGTLTLSGGTLNLGGTFNLAALGIFQRVGGTVNLRGTLNNTGTVLNLNATTGSWYLDSGTIIGGTITSQDGAQLVILGSVTPSEFNNVTFNGDLGLSNDTALTVVNGLTFNGTLTMGGYFSSGALLFQGTQTLDGMATIVFQRSGGRPDALAVTTNDSTLVLGPNVIVHGLSGEVGHSLWSSASNIGLAIEGTVSADVPGQTITLAAATIDNQGTLQALNGGSLSLQRQGTTGSITNEGSVYVDAGSSFLANANYVQYTGATMLAGGTLTAPLVDVEGGLLQGSGIIMGSVQNAAVLEVGFDGVLGALAITGDYTQTAAGSLAMQIGGTDAGTGYDTLSVGGTATLDGTLDITVLDDFHVRAGDTFTLLTFGQRTGDFATYNGLNPQGQKVFFDPEFDDTSLTLVAVPFSERLQPIAAPISVG